MLCEVEHLVPVVDVGHNHASRGDWHPLVGVSVHHVHLIMLCLIAVKNFKVFKELATIHHCDLLVSVGRESHGEPATVLGEDWGLLQLQPAARRCHDQVVLAVTPVERVFVRLERESIRPLRLKGCT